MPETVLKLVLEYDGAAYHGWQVQPGLRTVQADLERALSVILRTPVAVVGQGRTDRGVHAEAQTAHVVLPAGYPDLDDLRRRLNGLLGGTCAVRALTWAPPGFHARYSAGARRYRYQITRTPSPLRRTTHWHVHGPLDLTLIREMLPLCLGEHDFGHFCSHRSGSDHTRCTVTAFTLEEQGTELTFRIAANRFLHHMVRRLVGEMVQLGRGVHSPVFFRERLDAPGPAAKGLTAPPQGLFLEDVIYPE